MDTVIAKIAGFGVPGLILIVSINATGLAGAAALTTSLAAFGPGGMIAGIFSLGVVAFAADALTKYGFEAVLKGVVRELYRQGETIETIKEKVSEYPISKGLKLRLFDELDNIDASSMGTDSDTTETQGDHFGQNAAKQTCNDNCWAWYARGRGLWLE